MYPPDPKHRRPPGPRHRGPVRAPAGSHGEFRPRTGTFYLDEEGYLLRQMRVEGLSGAVSEEERARIRQQMEQLQQQLEDMPESRRETVEGMTAPRLERMREMLGSGAMELTLRVTELKLSERPPRGS